MSTISYIKNFVKDPLVASVTPTSLSAIRRICERIDFTTTRRIVEYGPGSGVISEYLLARMHPDAELILIERNLEFADMLRRTLRDDRVLVYHEDARNVRQVLRRRGAMHVEVLISGIPFSLLKPDVREHIIRESHEVLAPGGMFLAYQTFWQSNDHLLGYLKRYFEHVNTGFELLCAPPIRIYQASKNSNGHAGNGVY
jgi:phosphatidylethanolamine/phosphatidyl-N-methylethanolamine N-methyltransferase